MYRVLSGTVGLQLRLTVVLYLLLSSFTSFCVLLPCLLVHFFFFLTSSAFFSRQAGSDRPTDYSLLRIEAATFRKEPSSPTFAKQKYPEFAFVRVFAQGGLRRKRARVSLAQKTDKDFSQF